MKTYESKLLELSATIPALTILSVLFAIQSMPAQSTTAVALEKEERPVMLSVFEVSTERDVGYKATNAVGATRLNVPIVDTAQNISVFNSLLIEDTQSFNLTALVNFDASFTPTQDDKGTYFSRGFTANATYVDGLPQRNTFGPNYTANVDRVEILKGPSAILYGQGAGGATINRVLKRAMPKFSTSVTTTGASFDFWRAQFDTTGPISWRIADRPLAYRLNVAWQDGHTFKLESKNKGLLYSPAFSIPLGKHTDLDLNFTYDKTNLTGNFAHPVINGVPGRVVLSNGTALQIPIRNSFGEPFDERPIEKTLTSYDFRHEFNSHLSFRSQYQFETYKQADSEIFSQIGSYVITAASASIKRVYRDQNIDLRADRTRNEFVGNFATGLVEHKTLVGFSFDETNQYQLYYQNAATAVPAMDMVHPVFGNYALPSLTSVPVVTNQQTKSIASAWYANELAALIPNRLFLQAGFRSQYTYQRNNNRLTRVVSAIPTTADTSSFGMVWHLNQAKSLSLWASASSAFEPNFRVNPDGATLPATTGNTQEGGLKFDLLRGTINGTLSTYRTVRDKLPVAAPDLGDGYFRPGPGQTSQGFEASASYNPSRRFQINASYAYLDAYTTATRKTIDNCSKHSFSTFLRYEQPDGRLKGAFTTVGYIYRGTRDPTSTATTQPSWVVPEFKRLDLGLGYGWKMGRVAYRATVNLENAIDALLFGDNSQNDRYAMLAPRTWRISLRAQF